MVSAILEKELHQQLEHLPYGQQQQVLEFARALAATRTHGVTGENLLKFAGAINVEDLTTMSHAIEDGCEQVNIDEW